MSDDNFQEGRKVPAKVRERYNLKDACIVYVHEAADRLGHRVYDITAFHVESAHTRAFTHRLRGRYTNKYKQTNTVKENIHTYAAAAPHTHD